jgi:hypothetical protein
MPRTFSYKDGSKLNHKMASKYASYEDDTENLTIGNGWEKSWVPLNKNELMTIPWMKDAIEGTDAKLFIDDCLGFDIQEVTDAGAIHLKKPEGSWWNYESHLRILKNTKKSRRFLLMGYDCVKGGEWEADPNYPRSITTATVSANFGTLSDGFRVFTDGEKKYYYSKDGKERLAKRIIYDDDDYYCSCCCPDYDYEWD